MTAEDNRQFEASLGEIIEGFSLGKLNLTQAEARLEALIDSIDGDRKVPYHLYLKFAEVLPSLVPYLKGENKRKIVVGSLSSEYDTVIEGDAILHEKARVFVLNYKLRHPEFTCWLRERNKNGRLSKGFWFQGKEDYAFVGLYKASGGNKATRSVGLVFWHSRPPHIGISFEIIFRNEKDSRLLKFYSSMRQELEKDYRDQFEILEENRYRITLGENDPYLEAEQFLNRYKNSFDKLAIDLGLENILISQSEYDEKLAKIEEIRESLIGQRPYTENQPAGNTALDVDQGDDDDEDDSYAPPHTSNSNVNLHPDVPSEMDDLGREPFVQALLEYIKRLWAEKPVVKTISFFGRKFQWHPGRWRRCYNQYQKSYTIHINGEWGSGKSTFLNLLRKKLETTSVEKGVPGWIVVEFNAWQNQHIQVPWWVFLNTVYHTIKRKSPSLKSLWIFIREQWWRLVSMNVGKWIAFLILGAIIAITFHYDNSFLQIQKLIAKDTNDKLTVISSMLSLIGAVFLFFYGILNSLLPGSEEAAKNYKVNVSDPMQKIKNHYTSIINYTPKNVAVFIDDIDRCDARVVVQLLEGLQTLFRTNRVLYIIAGDASWIRKSFELHYADLKDIINKPGQSLGNFFVEKTLQHSIILPPITEEVRKTFWNKLLGGQEVKVDETKYKDSVSKMESARSDTERNSLIQGANSSEEKVVLQRKAAEKATSDQVISEIEHELFKYHQYLDPNPRSMIRLVNNIALEKAANYLGGTSDKISQDTLIRWAILKSKYPLLAVDMVKADITIDNQDVRNDVVSLLEGVDIRLIRKYKS